MATNLFNLTGKTALITGGGSGLGKGMAIALLEAGASVIIAGRNEEKLKLAKKEISKSSNNDIYILQLDVSLKEDLLQLEERLASFPSIDILVNAAGINIRNPILETTIDEWDKVLNTNLRGAYFVSQIVAKGMMEKGNGKIIQITSLSSTLGLPNMGPYGASKGGAAQITKSMATEWAPNIQVNAIAPGYFETDMTRAVLHEDPVRSQQILDKIPQKRTGKIDDLKGAVIYLSSEASDYVTGQTLYVDGGWTAS